VRVCVTAQHRQMLDQVLEAFSITPDHDLNIMKESQDLFDITTGCLAALRPVLKTEQPDYVIVQGDTTTTFCASLAAFYQGSAVAHVEAGLRTNQKRSPFPEEINRRMTATLADLHFAPTENARRALLAEGIDPSFVIVTGNTVVDALLETCRRHAGAWPAVAGLRPIPSDRRMILFTGHRRESFGDTFRNICHALAAIAKRSDVEIVYPVHLNPNVRGPVFEILGGVERVQLIDPVPYVPFVGLMQQSHLILTDSGGIQEEAPSLRKPVLVMRSVTERREAIDAGAAALVGVDATSIIENVNRLLDDDALYQRMSQVENPYGDGQASARIIDRILCS
jgi:UDP-N-acetylglucosamine 2-epimerase (non-hydrolysing)